MNEETKPKWRVLDQEDDITQEGDEIFTRLEDENGEGESEWWEVDGGHIGIRPIADEWPWPFRRKMTPAEVNAEELKEALVQLLDLDKNVVGDSARRTPILAKIRAIIDKVTV